MSICITYAGEALIASLQAQGLPLVIDSMIFANVPGQDTAKPADRGQALPTVHIVHSAPIPPEFRSFVNPNQVVYSVLLGSDVGDFAFNWQGLYCSEHQTLIAVAEMPAIEKRANDAGTNTPGNNLTRNFMLQFSGAQALTGLTVEAEVWQLDFTVRLKGIDERERLSNRDIYGRAAFLDDGWLLVKGAGSHHFEPGTSYVEGIRAPLANQTPAVPAPLPCDVFLDVCQAPQGSDVVTLVTPRFVAQGAGLPDYAEGAPFHTQHYSVQIAHVAADGTVTDLRPKDLPLVDSSLDTHNLDPTAHPDLRAAIAGIVIPTATETVAGIIKKSTAAQAIAGAGGGAIVPETLHGAVSGAVHGYTKAQYAVVTDRGTNVSGTQAVDCDVNQEVRAGLTGAVTWAAPTSMTLGKTVVLDVYATAAQTMSWGTGWLGNGNLALPTSVAAGKRLRMGFACVWDYASGSMVLQLMALVPGV